MDTITIVDGTTMDELRKKVAKTKERKLIKQRRKAKRRQMRGW